MKQTTACSEVAVRILKVASCPSLSGQSTLTYHVGCAKETDVEKGDAPEICFRVFGNSGRGFFSNEWIAMSAIQKAFGTVPAGIALTAHLLSPLFRGKSANTQGFLFAVLKNEGLVSNVKDSKGLFGRADASSFMAEVKALIASTADLRVDEKPMTAPAVKAQKPVPEKSRKTTAKLSPAASRAAASGTKAATKDGGSHGGNE